MDSILDTPATAVSDISALVAQIESIGYSFDLDTDSWLLSNGARCVSVFFLSGAVEFVFYERAMDDELSYPVEPFVFRTVRLLTATVDLDQVASLANEFSAELFAVRA